MIYSLPNGKILDTFADVKLDVAEMMTSPLDRVENTVERGENVGYQHFLLLPTVFSKAFFFRVVKSLECVVKSFKPKFRLIILKTKDKKYEFKLAMFSLTLYQTILLQTTEF